MERVFSLILGAVLLVGMCACGAGESAATWQEQYDLGIRYLSEGNYEEAIIAFTAAIEIDPKQAPAYVGRGDAYMGSGGTEENLAAAQVDYETAVKLDETCAQAYLGLAKIYIGLKDYDKAREILSLGFEKSGDEVLEEMLLEIPLEEVSDDGLNPYGGTSFTLREEYIPFLDLSEEEQGFIEQAVNAAINNDKEALLALAEMGEEIASAHEASAQISANLYTIWNNYKIGLFDETMGTNGESHTQAFWEMQIRSKNDIGYYISAYHYKILDPSTVTDGFYHEYSWSVRIGTCPCVDWQWNGALEITESSEGLQHFEEDGGFSRIITSTFLTRGEMKDSLKDGSFEITYELIYDYPDGEYEEDHFTETESLVYSGGKCIEDIITDERLNQRQGYNVSESYETIWSGRYGYALTSGDFLDLLYW